jgi:hypothetical protein
MKNYPSIWPWIASFATGSLAAGCVAFSIRRTGAMKSFLVMFLLCLVAGLVSQHIKGQQQILKEKSEMVKKRFEEQKTAQDIGP